MIHTVLVAVLREVSPEPYDMDWEAEEKLFGVNFDQHQYAYRADRSTEDAIATGLHTVLIHQQGAYVRLQFGIHSYCPQ